MAFCRNPSSIFRLPPAVFLPGKGRRQDGSHPLPARGATQIPKPRRANQNNPGSSLPPSCASVTRASSRRDESAPIWRGKSRRSVRLIRLSTAGDERWSGNSAYDFVFSLRELRLQDLAEENADVSINLSVHKHTKFGFSVGGRIMTSLTRNCRNCHSPYCREIDTTFNVWILALSRTNNSSIPEIGDDPSVIYVKPGDEADLDSLVQDTIRLAASVDESCSESCKQLEPLVINQSGGRAGSSIDGRWIRLVELRRAYSLQANEHKSV